jgi:hypothetical protein
MELITENIKCQILKLLLKIKFITSSTFPWKKWATVQPVRHLNQAAVEIIVSRCVAHMVE